MGFSSIDTTHADVEYRTNLGQFRADQTAIRAEYARTTGAMSDQALRAAVAQEKLDRAIARSGPESTAAKAATLAYRREMAALATEGRNVGVSLAEGGAGARTFEREISAAGRGALAGSGLFKGLGRAVAFSSSLFLGGTGLVYAIRAATTAAEEHQATESQVGAAVRAAGLDYESYRKQIDDTLASQRALTGFTEDETTRAFIAMVRNTRDVGSALHYTQEAQQISIGSGKDFTAVAIAVSKAVAGNTASLKRLGIELPKGVSGYRALQILGAKYAGSIKAHAQDATLVQQRLNQELHQTEVIVGTGILPELTHYEDHLGTWLSKTDNQRRLQHDVNTAVHDGAIIIKDAANVVHLFADAIKVADKVTGSFENTVELAFGAATLLKISKTRRGAALLRGELFRIGPTTAASAATAETALGGITAAETTAVTEAETLQTRLLAFNGLAINPIVIPIVLAYTATRLGHGDPLGIDHLLTKGGSIGDFLIGPPGNRGILGNFLHKELGIGSDGESSVPAGTVANNGGAVPKPRNGVPAAPPVGGRSQSRPDRLTQIQLAVQAAQLGVSRGAPGAQQQLIAALKAEIDYDRQYEAIQKRLYDNAKNPKDRASHAQTLERLQQDESSALDQITAIDQANAEKAAELARKRAAAARKRAEAAKRAQEQLAKRRRAQLEALTQAPVDLRIAEQTAKAHGASEEKLLAIYDREKKALEAQVKTLEKIGAAKKYILAARQHEAAIQSKIDAITKKKHGKAEDIFAEAAAEFAQYGSNIAGLFGPLSGQDTRGLLGALLLETKKGNRTHAAVERNTRGGRPAAIDGARLAATGGF